ncbi:hypothetical protein ABTF50_19870, partial [Acinetobacter baumannii]
MKCCDYDALLGPSPLDRRALLRLGAAAATALTLPSLARAQEIASARVGSASLKILTDGGITLPASM